MVYHLFAHAAVYGDVFAVDEAGFFGYMAYDSIIAPGLRASRGVSSEGTSERASGELAAPAVTTSSAHTITANKSHQMTAAEYLEQHQPRVPALPYSAPIFDDRHARTNPQILCMSTGTRLDDDGVHLDGTCTCLTEQGTRYALELQQCRHIARFGPPYNPYRQSYEEKTSNVKLRDSDGGQSFASTAQPMPAASHGAVVGYSGDLPGGNPNL